MHSSPSGQGLQSKPLGQPHSWQLFTTLLFVLQKFGFGPVQVLIEVHSGAGGVKTGLPSTSSHVERGYFVRSCAQVQPCASTEKLCDAGHSSSASGIPSRSSSG